MYKIVLKVNFLYLYFDLGGGQICSVAVPARFLLKNEYWKNGNNFCQEIGRGTQGASAFASSNYGLTILQNPSYL